MSSYLPSFQLTPVVHEAIRAGTIQLQTGQWVSSSCGDRGRVVMRRSHCGFVVWRLRGESFSCYQARFSAACRDRFELRSLSDLPVKMIPASARRCRFSIPAPRLPSIRPFCRIPRPKKDCTLPLPFAASRSVSERVTVPFIPSWRAYEGCSNVSLH